MTTLKSCKCQKKHGAAVKEEEIDSNVAINKRWTGFSVLPSVGAYDAGDKDNIASLKGPSSALIY